MVRKIWVLCCLLLTLAMPVGATNWYWAGRDYGGNQWYIDNDSVVKQESKGVAIVWTKTVSTDGSILIERSVFGRSRYLMVVRTLQYDSNGTLVRDRSYRGTIVSIPPNTVGDAIYRLIWGN